MAYLACRMKMPLVSVNILRFNAKERKKFLDRKKVLEIEDKNELV